MKKISEIDHAHVLIFSEHEPDFSVFDIQEGDWVVIKPNLVKQSKENDPNEWRSVVTDAGLIRKVCNHVCSELAGSGRVTICDAPQTDSSFERIAELLGLQHIAKECSKKYRVPVEVVDLRNEEWVSVDGIVSDRYKLAVVSSFGKVLGFAWGRRTIKTGKVLWQQIKHQLTMGYFTEIRKC